MMSDHLREAPVQLLRTHTAEPHRLQRRIAHLLCRQIHLKLNVNPLLSILSRREIRQWLRVTLSASGELHSIGRERLHRHHPWRDGGGKALTKKRSERLILPRLNIARRPVIQQAHPENVLL